MRWFTEPYSGAGALPDPPWENLAGTSTQTGGFLDATSAPSAQFRNDIAFGPEISASITINSLSTNGLEVFYRYNPATGNGYSFRVSTSNGGTARISQLDAGVATTLDSVTGVGTANGDVFTVTVDVAGNHAAQKNGVAIAGLFVNDTTYAGTRIATFQPSTTDLIDQLVAYDRRHLAVLGSC